MIKKFELHRDVDHSGVSGTGVVADGVVYQTPYLASWPDGTSRLLPAGWVRLAWRGKYRSTTLWDSVSDAMAVHGNDGSTRLVWTGGTVHVGKQPDGPPPWMAVVPHGDLVGHDVDAQDDCVCLPDVKLVTRPDGSCGQVYVHHALDGRDQAGSAAPGTGG